MNEFSSTVRVVWFVSEDGDESEKMRLQKIFNQRLQKPLRLVKPLIC